MIDILECRTCRQYKIGKCIAKPNDPICEKYVPDVAPELKPIEADILVDQKPHPNDTNDAWIITTHDNTPDMVHHPSHYCQGGIECIKAIEASMDSEGFQDYCKGNVLKYLWRWRDKAGVQDLEKAKVYLDWLIESAKKDLEADMKECL